MNLHEARSYEVADKVYCHRDDRIHFLEEASLVFWEPKWECADNFRHPSNQSQVHMPQAYEDEKASRHLNWLPHPADIRILAKPNWTDKANGSFKTAGLRGCCGISQG